MEPVGHSNVSITNIARNCDSASIGILVQPLHNMAVLAVSLGLPLLLRLVVLLLLLITVMLLLLLLLAILLLMTTISHLRLSTVICSGGSSLLVTLIHLLHLRLHAITTHGLSIPLHRLLLHSIASHWLLHHLRLSVHVHLGLLHAISSHRLLHHLGLTVHIHLRLHTISSLHHHRLHTHLIHHWLNILNRHHTRSRMHEVLHLLSTHSVTSTINIIDGLLSLFGDLKFSLELLLLLHHPLFFLLEGTLISTLGLSLSKFL